LLFLATTKAALGADESTFMEGSRAYQGGDYPAAAQAWEAPGRTSSGTLHNLGNAQFKLGHPGPAILAWERALAIKPSSKNTAANLRFARSQGGLGEPQYPWHEKYSALLSPGLWLFVASLSFWGAIALLAVPPLLKQRRAAWTQATAVVAIAVFLLTVPALAGLLSRAHLGVILAPETELRLTPTREAEFSESLLRVNSPGSRKSGAISSTSVAQPIAPAGFKARSSRRSGRSRVQEAAQPLVRFFQLNIHLHARLRRDGDAPRHIAGQRITKPCASSRRTVDEQYLLRLYLRGKGAQVLARRVAAEIELPQLAIQRQRCLSLFELHQATCRRSLDYPGWGIRIRITDKEQRVIRIAQHPSRENV
jgi:hypothetical protein